MRRITLLVTIALFSATLTFAQLDYPDYRNKKESFTKVTDKPIRLDLATFTMGGVEESIGKEKLRKIAPDYYTKNVLHIKGDDIEVSVTLAPFDAGGKKLKMAGEHLVKIDNKPLYGSYGQTPQTRIKEVKVIIKKDTILLPPAAFDDLFNMNFTYKDNNKVERTANAIYFAPHGNRFYVYLLSRDATGSYEVTWIFENGVYLRRVLDYGFTL